MRTRAFDHGEARPSLGVTLEAQLRSWTLHPRQRTECDHGASLAAGDYAKVRR